MCSISVTVCASGSCPASASAARYSRILPATSSIDWPSRWVSTFAPAAPASRTVAEEALEAGAAGFLPKTMAARSLRNAVRFMAAGETFAPVSFMAQKEDDPAHAFDELLTDREKQVLIGLTKAQSNKAIARDLDLQEVTVKLHVKTLSRKLNARNRTHAALIAKEAGFV